MERLSSYIAQFPHKLIGKHQLMWLLITFGLVGVFLLARVAEPNNWTVFKQLSVLYVVDSLLFFFTDRTNAKMGVLSLIFLTTMEAIVALFYVISLVSASRI
jgi:hypothetical protein